MEKLKSRCCGAWVGYWKDQNTDEKHELVIIPICSKCKFPAKTERIEVNREDYVN